MDTKRTNVRCSLQREPDPEGMQRCAATKFREQLPMPYAAGSVFMLMSEGLKVILMCSFVLLFLLLIHTARARFPTDLSHFDYDSNTELNVKELSVVERNDVMIHELTYTSPRGGAVPAYVVVPGAKGKFAGIVWGHWMMPKSPTANKTEILTEAIALAPTRSCINPHRYSIRAARLQRRS